MAKPDTLADFLSQSEEDLEALAEELERRDEAAKTKLLADAKEDKFDALTTKLLADLDKAKEKRPNSSEDIDVIIARAKAMEFHDGVEPLAMTNLVGAIQVKSVVPAHLDHIYRAVLNGDYDA
jgi:hypothetical protein